MLVWQWNKNLSVQLLCGECQTSCSRVPVTCDSTEPAQWPPFISALQSWNQPGVIRWCWWDTRGFLWAEWAVFISLFHLWLRAGYVACRCSDKDIANAFPTVVGLGTPVTAFGTDRKPTQNGRSSHDCCFSVCLLWPWSKPSWRNRVWNKLAARDLAPSESVKAEVAVTCWGWSTHTVLGCPGLLCLVGKHSIFPCTHILHLQMLNGKYVPMLFTAFAS